MSDAMLLSILRQPFSDYPSDMSLIEWVQVRDRMRQAADELEKARAELAAERERAERHADALRLVSDQCGEYQRVIADLKLERDALIKAVAKIRPMDALLAETKES